MHKLNIKQSQGKMYALQVSMPGQNVKSRKKRDTVESDTVERQSKEKKGILCGAYSHIM